MCQRYRVGGFGPRKGESSSRVAGKSRGVLPGRRLAPENHQVHPPTLERAQKQLSRLPQASHEGEMTTIRLAGVGLLI